MRRVTLYYHTNREAAQLTKTVAVYAAGLSLGVLAMASLAALLGSGQALTWFTAGWLAWSGVVAVVVFRSVARMDRADKRRQYLDSQRDAQASGGSMPWNGILSMQAPAGPHTHQGKSAEP
jgi:hypothetical protein